MKNHVTSHPQHPMIWIAMDNKIHIVKKPQHSAIWGTTAAGMSCPGGIPPETHLMEEIPYMMADAETKIIAADIIKSGQADETLKELFTNLYLLPELPSDKDTLDILYIENRNLIWDRTKSSTHLLTENYCIIWMQTPAAEECKKYRANSPLNNTLIFKGNNSTTDEMISGEWIAPCDGVISVKMCTDTEIKKNESIQKIIRQIKLKQTAEVNKITERELESFKKNILS